MWYYLLPSLCKFLYGWKVVGCRGGCSYTLGFFLGYVF